MSCIEAHEYVECPSIELSVHGLYNIYFVVQHTQMDHICPNQSWKYIYIYIYIYFFLTRKGFICGLNKGYDVFSTVIFNFMPRFTIKSG